MLMGENAGICACPMECMWQSGQLILLCVWGLNSGHQTCALFPAEPPY